MKVCIIGGGLTGLTAALELGLDHDVTLLEKEQYLGGCLSSYRIGSYWIERFYHHCFTGDAGLLALIDKLGLGSLVEWRNGTTGTYAGGKIYPLNTPIEILSYPLLNLRDKAKLARLTMNAGKTDPMPLDDIPAVEYLVDRVGRNAYESFFDPLLTAKFGDRKTDVSAAWIISRIAIRSNRGLSGEQLGYIKGGFQLLIDAMESRIAAAGTKLVKATPVQRIERQTDGWRVNSERYDAVIATIPPQAIPFPGSFGVAPIPYQGAACMAIGLDSEVTDGIYWLNMKDQAPYGAVITHTNFIPQERYGEAIVYLGSYFGGSLPADTGERMLADFCARFGVPRGSVRWHRLAVEPLAGPVYVRCYRRMIPDYRHDGFFIAGMYSRPNYPERSMEGSISAGHEVAGLVGEQEETRT